MGIAEFGLPYVADPAVTRHLAAFLRRHRAAAAGINPARASASASGLARPDAILYNGAALTPASIRERLRDQGAVWFVESRATPALRRSSLALAVARGAAYYGMCGGQGASTAERRGYYVAIDLSRSTPAAAAAAGVADPLAVVSLARRAAGKGRRSSASIALFARTNRPVAFNIYSS
jgi:hypothetical protein